MMGRNTYEHAVKFGMADGYSGKNNYVLSRTLTKAVSNRVTVIRDDVAAFAEHHRAENGQHVWLVGGVEIIAAFLDAGAVDEFVLHVIPYMIGEGIPLMSPRHNDVPLKLLSRQAVPRLPMSAITKRSGRSRASKE